MEYMSDPILPDIKRDIDDHIDLFETLPACRTSRR